MVREYVRNVSLGDKKYRIIYRLYLELSRTEICHRCDNGEYMFDDPEIVEIQDLDTSEAVSITESEEDKIIDIIRTSLGRYPICLNCLVAKLGTPRI